MSQHASTRRRIILGCFGAVAWALGASRSLQAQAASSEPRLPPLDDLRPLAAMIARHKAPLLVLFSTPGCPFCREVRRNYLMPRVEQARSPTPSLLLREVDITSERPIVQLNGARTTEADFAAGFNVRMVPVVALFGPALQLLVEPLVGLDRSGLYEGTLANTIETARQRLQ